MRWLKLAVIPVVVALVGAVLPPAGAEASTTRNTFIASLVRGAQENQSRTGIPASVTIGMAALETGYGRSSMTRTMTVGGKRYQVNTLFNIKCTAYTSPYQTGCVPVASYEYRADGSRYLVVSRFRTYANWNQSILDYGRLLRSAPRYASAFRYTKDPDRFVTEVRRGGYATDPKYAHLVISIMRKHDLYRYDVNTSRVRSSTSQGTGRLPELRQASSGHSVRTLQTLLNARGHRLAVDGRYGARTRAAVASFQRSVRVPVTGAVDSRTWGKLLPVLRRGASGPAVRGLQAELRASKQSVRVTGVFDVSTQRAVKAFQVRHGIKQTGTVAILTWTALLSS